jgi:hypothetical protein
MTMFGRMAPTVKKRLYSLVPCSSIESSEAEAFAHSKFIRVLQSWASDRLASNAKEHAKVKIRKAA